VPVADADLFLSDPAAKGAPEPARPVFEMAQAATRPYAHRLKTFETGVVVPGIEAVPLPGHSPGHSGFRIHSDGSTLLVWGDIVHVPAVQAARPDVGMIFDADPELAMSHRQTLFSNLAESADLVAGMHLQFPGFGHVAKRATGYEIVPLIWTP
jgi:glyoxylase-like metal-dependent hydrolase (beta-lactamase superfamily II)